MSLRNLIAGAGLVVVLAVLAPQYGPGLMARFISSGWAEREAGPEPAAGPTGPSPVVPHPTGDRRRDLPRTVALRADARGHFLVEAVVNGRRIEAMVDTGATIVALTEATARRLGVLPAKGAFRQPVSTANGIVMTAPVMLAEVSVSGVRVRNVAASVIEGEGLGVNLLGMSFLGRLKKFEVSGDRLVLTQ